METNKTPRKPSKTYNGHKNYNYWNVSLWFGSDEGMYRTALEYVRHCGSKDKAAAALLDMLQSSGITKTPDGVTYNKSNIRAALRGLE